MESWGIHRPFVTFLDLKEKKGRGGKKGRRGEGEEGRKGRRGGGEEGKRRTRIGKNGERAEGIRLSRWLICRQL